MIRVITAAPFKEQLFATQAEIEAATGNRPLALLNDANQAEDIR